MDGSSLTENAGPAVGCGVVEKIPWKALGLKDGIPALADPQQGVGDAAENEGARPSRLRWVRCQSKWQILLGWPLQLGHVQARHR